MVSHLVFYQLGLIALVWVFLILSGLWPSEPAAARPMTPKPLMPRGKRSKKPQPFQGLTRKPCCAACEQAIEVDPNTVLQWLVEAADHLQAFSQYFLHDVRVTQVQLDELYALLCAVKDGEVSEAEALQRLSRSPHWVWAAIDPVSKLLLTIEVGERTRAMAQRVVHQVAQVLAPGCVPLFLTDGFKEYATAFLTHFRSEERRVGK